MTYSDGIWNWIIDFQDMKVLLFLAFLLVLLLGIPDIEAQFSGFLGPINWPWLVNYPYPSKENNKCDVTTELNSDIFSLVLSSLFRGPKSGSRMLLTGDQNGGGYRPGIWWGSRQRGWCSLDFRSLEKHACDAKYKIIPFRQEIRIPGCGRASVGRHEIRIRCHIKLTWGIQT